MSLPIAFHPQQDPAGITAHLAHRPRPVDLWTQPEMAIGHWALIEAGLPLRG
ncbi:MAG: hypothetical protein ACREN8_11635 [Candidatus Dormibacteraceae bacterium]